MGLPTDVRAKVLAIERCPRIDGGAGRVVLTTVNHLNGNAYQITVKMLKAGVKYHRQRMNAINRASHEPRDDGDRITMFGPGGGTWYRIRYRMGGILTEFM